MSDQRVGVLRKILRGYQAWESAYEADGVDVIVDDLGNEWSIYDLRTILDEGLRLLTPRQAQSIRLMLVDGRRETDVARIMGIDEENPVGMYATAGIKSLLELLDENRLPGFPQNGLAA